MNRRAFFAALAAPFVARFLPKPAPGTATGMLMQEDQAVGRLNARWTDGRALVHYGRWASTQWEWTVHPEQARAWADLKARIDWKESYRAERIARRRAR